MTRNAKMSWPGEMATETVSLDIGKDGFAPKAAKRMAGICATPAEVEMYQYNPNGARKNLRPGIPVEDDYNSLNSDTYSD